MSHSREVMLGSEQSSPSPPSHLFTILSSDEDHSGGRDHERDQVISSHHTQSDASPNTASSSSSSTATLIGGNSTTMGASMNFINSIVGAGIIGIPYAIQQCGFILGMILLLLVAYFVKQSVIILIDCGMKHEIYNLEDLCEYLLGNKGYYIALLCMFLFAYGGQIAYLVIVGDTVPMVAEFVSPSNNDGQNHHSSSSIFHDRNSVMILFSVFIILPICLLRDLSHLAWTSSLSIIADMILIIVVLIAAISATKEQSQHFQEHDLDSINLSFFAGVGTMSFAFVCQHNSFLVFKSLKQPTLQQWDKVARISIFTAYALTLSLGLIGFFAFYPYVQSDLLNNFPANYITICIGRSLLAISMVLTYPVELYVARHCVVVLYYRYTRYSTVSESHSRNRSDSSNRYRGHMQALPTDSSHHPQINSTGSDSEGIEMNSSSVRGGPTAPGDDSEDGETEVVFNPYYRKANRPMDLTERAEYVSVEVASPSRTIQDGSGGSEEGEGQRVGRHGDDIRNRSQRRECEEIPLFYHVLVTLILWGTTLLIALTSKTLGVVSGLTGAAAASTVGYTLPGLIYFYTYEQDFRSMVQIVKSFTYQRVINQSKAQHMHLRDHDEESSNPSHHKLVGIDVWKTIRPFVLPACMVVFGVLSMIIGIATILSS